MTAGSEIDHLAREALELGHSETIWPMLRNVYFRAGSTEEAWNDMAAWFAMRGVKATAEWRTVNGSQVQFVLLTRQA